MSTTASFRAGIKAVLVAYSATHPTHIASVASSRLASITELPCAFVDLQPETVTYDSGLRTRTFSPQAVVVFTPNDETQALMDDCRDGLMDAFSLVPQFLAGTIWSSMTVTEAVESSGSTNFPALVFTFPNVTIQEGRI